jgi:hypothetical protein
MTAIAFLGIFFLPAMFVAVRTFLFFIKNLPLFPGANEPFKTKSIFSMSMFDFSSPSNSSQTSAPTTTSNSIVNSKYFGIYWGITIPLTLLILLMWKLWMRRNKEKDTKTRNEPLRTERVMEYQRRVDESMDMNTPFYPGKGSLANMFWGMEKNI